MENWRINQLKEMLESSPQDEFIIYALAKEHMNLGNDETALAYFVQLKAQNSNYVGLYFHLAQLYRDMDNVNDALSTYDEGIKIANKLGDLHALSELKNAKLNFELEL